FVHWYLSGSPMPPSRELSAFASKSLAGVPRPTVMSGPASTPGARLPVLGRTVRQIVSSARLSMRTGSPLADVTGSLGTMLLRTVSPIVAKIFVSPDHVPGTPDAFSVALWYELSDRALSMEIT